MFLTFEGLDGSGKTSHINCLVKYIQEQGYTVFSTCEPGGTPIGEEVREMLHNLKNTDMDVRTETLLFQATRAQLVEKEIKPRLAKGEIVISDRYTDSTLAYQGYGHQQDLAQIRSLINYATEGFVPDLTIYLDVDVETGLNRKRKADEWNRMDAYPIEFHQRVRTGYLEMIENEPKRWVWIDAEKEWDIVQSSIRKEIEQYLKKVKVYA